MRIVFVCAISAAMLAGCGIGVKYPRFGEASYRMEGLTTPANGGAATHTVIYRDGAKMRVEAALPTLGEATIVFDDATNAAYVLDPARAPTGAPSTTTPTMPGAAPSAVPASDAPTTVAVRIDDADAPQPLETAWEALGPQNARSAGDCRVAGERGHQWRPREEPEGVERVACITNDGIVLKVSENGRVLWETTSLHRGAQSAALFGVPAGYRMIDPQRLAAETGPHEPGSVVGAPPEPEQAPDPRG